MTGSHESNSHPDTTRASRSPDTGENGSELELFAIEEHFAAAVHAGAGPRLSDYLRRYPQYAEALTDFASVFLPEATLEAEDSNSDEEPPAPPGPALSPGTQRALDALRAGLDTHSQADETLLVAEERAAYATRPAGLEGLERLEALARVHGLSLEELAAKADLSQGALSEVAGAAAQAPGSPPPLLVRRIAEALGMSETDVILALAGGF